MSSTLPDPRTLLTDLFSALPSFSDQPASSITAPTSGPLPPSLKPALLTLHVLFPNELLPALDLLDRNLLTRFVGADSPSDISEQERERDVSCSPPKESQPNSQRKGTPLYYVRSSQQSRQYNPRHGPVETQPTPRYEVRPLAWNCSCPAFAFSAFPASSSTSGDEGVFAQGRDNLNARERVKRDGEDWHFGGLSRGGGIPMCKHLLACVMVERWRGFGDCVEERVVSIEELAGWGAGWGG